MTILAGDFNAEVGKRRHTNVSCLGMFPPGQTNDSGKTLIDFCSINHLFISNSAFNIQHIISLHGKAK